MYSSWIDNILLNILPRQLTFFQKPLSNYFSLEISCFHPIRSWNYLLEHVDSSLAIFGVLSTPPRPIWLLKRLSPGMVYINKSLLVSKPCCTTGILIKGASSLQWDNSNSISFNSNRCLVCKTKLVSSHSCNWQTTTFIPSLKISFFFHSPFYLQ